MSIHAAEMTMRLAIRVTFSDGSAYLLPLEPYLSRWAAQEGGSVAREVTAQPDMEFIHWCIESQREDVLRGWHPLYDDGKRRQFCDWLAETYTWAQVRRRARRVRGSRGLYSAHSREWPRAEMELVDVDVENESDAEGGEGSA